MEVSWLMRESPDFKPDFGLATQTLGCRVSSLGLYHRLAIEMLLDSF